MHKPLRILFLSSEADPFVKVGGLGDVAGSLPNAILNLHDGLEIKLVIPFYPMIKTDNFDINYELNFSILREGVKIPVQVFKTLKEDLEVYFISGEPFARINKVYDTDSAIDGEKFIFFSLAALELARKLNWRPDLVHSNDWHTAIALYAVKRSFGELFWYGVKTILTVHNLCYMGAGSEGSMNAYGLPPANSPDLPWWGQQTPMPLGLWAADEIIAVSPTYAQEIQTPEYGCGLEKYLFSRRETVVGIVNGIDTVFWNPENDQYLLRSYNSKKIEPRIENKLFLQKQFGLEQDSTIPLMTMVTRMDQQKGVDIAINALRILADMKWQVILLGSGNPEIEALAQKLEDDFPGRVHAAIRYDEKLSHQLYGGADMLLMPSRYEPCGLAQLIAMRYGTVPLARSTGGLRDTIEESVSGFLFADPEPNSMANALFKAINTFHIKKTWKRIQISGMEKNYSWNNSAYSYVAQYKKMIIE